MYEWLCCYGSSGSFILRYTRRRTLWTIASIKLKIIIKEYRRLFILGHQHTSTQLVRTIVVDLLLCSLPTGCFRDERWFKWLPCDKLARESSCIECWEQVIKCFCIFLAIGTSLYTFFNLLFVKDLSCNIYELWKVSIWQWLLR